MIYLIDASHLLHRIKHTPLAELFDSEGRPTGMVFGFFNSLCKIRRDTGNTARFVICWDKTTSSFRTEMYEEYKADRSARDSNISDEDRQKLAEYNEARMLIIELSNLLQIPTFQIHGVEADDIIGHFARKDLGERKVILSEDSDLFQLLNDSTDQYCPVNGKYVTQYSFVDEQGLHADKFREQYIMILAMTGTHNNVTGIKGIGFKTARKISEFLINGEEVPATSTKNKLFLTNQEIYHRNVKLVDIYHVLDTHNVSTMIKAEVTSRSCLGAPEYLFFDVMEYLKDLELNKIIDNLVTLENSGYKGNLL